MFSSHVFLYSFHSIPIRQILNSIHKIREKHNDISYMHLFSDGNPSYWTIARFNVDYPDLIKNEL